MNGPNLDAQRRSGCYETSGEVGCCQPVQPADGDWVANRNCGIVFGSRSPNTDCPCALAKLPPRACDGSLTTLGPRKDSGSPVGGRSFIFRTDVDLLGGFWTSAKNVPKIPGTNPFFATRDFRVFGAPKSGILGARSGFPVARATGARSRIGFMRSSGLYRVSPCASIN